MGYRDGDGAMVDGRRLLLSCALFCFLLACFVFAFFCFCSVAQLSKSQRLPITDFKRKVHHIYVSTSTDHCVNQSEREPRASQALNDHRY